MLRLGIVTAAALILLFPVPFTSQPVSASGAQGSTGSEQTAQKGEWIKTGDLEFRVAESRRSSLVQLTVKMYVGSVLDNRRESRFKPLVKSERGLRPNPKVYLKPGEEIAFVPFDDALAPQEKPLEIVTVILEVQPPEAQLAPDKASLLDKAGKTLITGDMLHSLLKNQLYDFGAAKLPENQRMFLFAVAPEQKDLRFRLAESPAVTLAE